MYIYIYTFTILYIYIGYIIYTYLYKFTIYYIYINIYAIFDILERSYTLKSNFYVYRWDLSHTQRDKCKSAQYH